jgi:uncharacterized protein YyaL (SSP411 family)
MKTNRLIREKSPYLLQHAQNPVDWYPWGEEAFARARQENKPIFLSIGYSTCHWCHVMEHESFEDLAVANLMNDVFVSIKVDREERPDIDNIYMSVCQMTTGSGGWPLTILMTPDKKPFFAGTYIPKENRFGRVGMLQFIPRIQEIWKTRQEDVRQSADQITTALQQLTTEIAGEIPDEEVLTISFDHFRQRYDEWYAGFGNAPKFPTPHQMYFLLRYWKRSGNQAALKMVEQTLQAMRRGGIYDQLGFGFHRYSTDRMWLVPHFEKMLYDQAMLAMAYTEAYQATGNKEFKRTVHEILAYVLRDMTAPEGGFYSAEDADSEGEEGKFYLWTESEIRKVLSAEDAEFILYAFHLKTDGNFIDPITGSGNHENILHLEKSVEALASGLKLPEKEFRKQLESIRQKLFLYREKRVHPYKDDQVLADWNGLMIAAFAKAALVFDDSSYLNAAKNAVEFIEKRMRNKDGSIIHRYREGAASLPAHVDDYAFLIWGLLELYEASFDPKYLQNALNLNQYLMDHFWDHQAGGFFFTADNSEELLVRKKELYDGAIPSGNSVAVLNLLKLGKITANPELEEKAAMLCRAFSGNVKEAPFAHTQYLLAIDFILGPSYEVVIAGNPDAGDIREMQNAIASRFVPNKVVILHPIVAGLSDIEQLAAYTKTQTSVDGKATAYVCQNYVCNQPTTDIQKMLEFLGQ